MLRGIVAAPAIFSAIANSGFAIDRMLSAQEIRYYLLYWDKVVIPTSNIIHVSLPDEDILIETGVISRPKVGSLSCGLANFPLDMALAQASVTESLIKNNKDADWVFHQIGGNLTLPQQYQIENQSIRVDLVNLLPVPIGTTPIPEILEFKLRRRDELAVLHQYLDEAYLEILASPDPTLSRKASITRLKTAIAAIDSVTKERWKTTTKFDFSSEISLQGSNIAKGVAAGYAFAFYSAEVSIPVGAILGGLASLIKLSAKVSKTFEPAKNQLKLGYLSHAHGDGIIQNDGVSRHFAPQGDFLSQNAMDFARQKLEEYRRKK